MFPLSSEGNSRWASQMRGGWAHVSRSRSEQGGLLCAGLGVNIKTAVSEMMAYS
jgi:hypothetical protein